MVAVSTQLLKPSSTKETANARILFILLSLQQNLGPGGRAILIEEENRKCTDGGGSSSSSGTGEAEARHETEGEKDANTKTKTKMRMRIGGFDARRVVYKGWVEVQRFVYGDGATGSYVVMSRDLGSPISWRQVWKALITSPAVEAHVLRK
ncbi:hypothetical protein E4T56_gene18273 [Termitomyces sp. T112]|nr:hypothetical protein E4T56_gene18273 [Termitomyces sp. T112]